MCSLNRLIEVVAISLMVTGCVSTPKKDAGWETWSYLEAKGSKVDALSALPKNDQEGRVFANVSMRANPSSDSTGLMSRSATASKEVLKNLCSASNGKKLSTNITVVLPNIPSGIPLEQASKLRREMQASAEAKIKAFYKNDFYSDKDSYYLTADTVAKASNDLKYVCPVPDSGFFMFVPKDKQFIFTFSPPKYDDNRLYYYCSEEVVYRQSEGHRPRKVLLVPTGEPITEDYKMCYPWAKPDRKLEGGDRKCPNPTWHENKNADTTLISEEISGKLYKYESARINEMDVLRYWFVIVAQEKMSTDDLIKKQFAIWDAYIKQFTSFSSSVVDDSTIRYQVTLDLAPACNEARHITDLYSK